VPPVLFSVADTVSAASKIHFEEEVLAAGTKQSRQADKHRHLSTIDCLKAHAACLVCFISTVNGNRKERKRSLERPALVAGT
jgi:hypothetical protein